MVAPRELVVFPAPVGAGTNLDFGLDGHHIVPVLEDWRGARFPPPSLPG